MKTPVICICIILGIVAFAMWACCKAAGECSREEERQDGK